MKLLEERKFADALSYFDQALIIHPRDPDLLNGKGASLRSLGRYDEALECFNMSLQIDPRDKNAS
ncbi:MAG: TPR repeat-containing protein [Cenarchaeum symbiont of Oopsacas minuta]|nr:TPR repeat-containing protein [Cenarchaeum symbiont of Oopsacas minuta]